MNQFRSSLAVVALAVAATAAPAAAKPSPMTLDDVARVKSIQSAHVAPDGGSVAFVEREPRDPFNGDDGPARTVLRVKRDRGPARVYVAGDLSVSNVVWARDSKSLYYLAKDKDDKNNALYRVPLDGGAQNRLCQLDGERSIAGFDVHPDGKRFAVIARPEAAKADKQANDGGFDAVVYEEGVKSNRLAIVEPRPQEACAFDPMVIRGHVMSAEFSPSGDRLLLNVAPSPHIDDKYMQSRLSIVGLDGSSLVRLETRGKLGKSTWSPDGKRVAFLGAEDFNDPREGRLKVASAKSGAVRDVLPKLEGHVMSMAWSGRREVTAVVHLGVDSEVWKVDVGSGKKRVLVGRGRRVARALSASRDGRAIALIADAPTHPRELFRLSRGGIRRVTRSNPWLAQRELGRQEAVTYQAVNGLELHGMVVYPLDYRKGKRYPLLVVVHGGPEAHYSNGWLSSYTSPVHVAAAEGFVTFVPNYRGSTGRGVAFSKLGQHDYAAAEFNDIVDGKEHLVALGVVDKSKVGITGGSYGGYATAWGATALSEHYAAGVMFVGISNQLSKFGTSDIPREMHAVHSRAWPWEDWQFMLERSPIYHAGNSKTPLLIMHGDADPRVHPSQSLEMYRYLKLNGKAPVRLVWYPGEGHGNRRAASQYDYSVRFMRWMNHYLRGPGGEPPAHDIDYSQRLKKD